ncbi:unnamed protein product [Caenorhabditis brenneri]
MTAQSKPVTPDTFPFWKLPPLARSHVTRLMEQADVIHLSMHSKLFKRLLKAFKIGGVTIKFKVFCYPEEEDSEVFIETYYDKPYEYVELWCTHADCWSFPENQHMLVHNNRMLVGKEGERFEVNSALTFQEQMSTMEHLTRHLLEIFHVEHFELRYQHTKQNHIFDSFIWGIIDKFRFIVVNSYNAPEKEDSLSEEEIENIDNLYGLTAEQTKFFFNEVKTDKLDFNAFISNAEELTGIQLKHREILFWNEDLLGLATIDHLIDAESEELWICFDDVEADDIMELLEKWQSGEKLTNLRRLNLSFVREDEHQPLIEMLEELEDVEKCQRQEADATGQRAYQVGPYTIRRTTDGKTATFHVSNAGLRFSCN